MSWQVLAWFTTAVDLTGRQRLLLMLPLCLAIALVYKAIRCEDVREMPGAVLTLWVTIVAGMSAVGAGLWLLYVIVV